MRPQFINLYLWLFLIGICSCNKEQLAHNPNIDSSSSTEEILNTKSFFDVGEKTFIITEDEYSDLFVSKTDSTYVFTQNEIFNNIEDYSFLGYPYFTNTPERYFMGSINMVESNENTLTFTLGKATYDDLYDDYLINTALPNGVLSPRNECNSDLSEISGTLIEDTNLLLSILSNQLLAEIQSEFDGTIFEDYEIGIELIGDVNGCVTYYDLKSAYYGAVIEDFELKDFGIKISFSSPSTDLASIQAGLKTAQYEDFESLFDDIGTVITDYLGTGEKSLVSVSAPIFGTRVGVCGGLEIDFSGEFIQENTLTINTSSPIKLEVRVDKSSFTAEHLINDVVGADIKSFLNFSGNSYLGGNAELVLELLGGITFGDLGGVFEVGILLGRKPTFGVDGQVGTYASTTGQNGNYLNGCGSLVVTDHAYLYAQSDSVSSFFKNTFDITIPNTIGIGTWPVYNIANDPQYKTPSSSIEYTKICFPDNCRDIDSGSSYFKINSISGDQVNCEYFVSNNNQPGFFNIIIEYPTFSQTIVENGVYNEGDTSIITIDDNSVINALLSQDQSNVNIKIEDINNACKKTLPKIFYDKECDQDVFIDPKTNLKLRAYNLDLDADGLSSCASTEDPVWVFQDATLASLYSFEPGYQSFDYMSKENCICYAESLSKDDADNTYSVPSYGLIESFIDQTSGVNYSMSNGNALCSNFAQTGYIILSTIGGCSNFWNSQPIAGVTTDYCINDPENAYFFVDNPDDPLNDYLFELTPSGTKTIKRSAKGVLAPCRLKVN